MGRGYGKDLMRRSSKISISTLDNIYSQNDEITGTVTILTGDEDLSGDGIVVQLLEYRDESTRTGSGWTRSTVVELSDTRTLSGPFTFGPGTLTDLSFRMKLPRNCRITDGSGGWYLGVDIIIPGIEDPKDFLDITVVPAEELMAVADTMEEDMRFTERVRSRRWDPKTGRTRFSFRPPEALGCEFDLVELDLEVASDGSVMGDILFDLQENSFRDYIRLVKGKDRVKRFFELSPEEVLLPDGSPNSDAIIHQMIRKIRYVIKDENKIC